MPTGTYVDMCANLPICDPEKITVPTLIMRGEYDGIAGFRDLINFFERLPNWILNGLNVNFYFGGTSLLIVVGVAMDTVNQIESQLIMRHYDGFTPKSGRIRGRRGW